MTEKGGFLRPRILRAVEQAAQNGFDGAERLWSMTPREAELALAAHAARQRERDARDERLAWMIGYYCAVAVHAPRRYPRRSGTAFRREESAGPMTEAQMKRALLAFAAERSNYDAGDAEN